MLCSSSAIKPALTFYSPTRKKNKKQNNVAGLNSSTGRVCFIPSPLPTCTPAVHARADACVRLLRTLSVRCFQHLMTEPLIFSLPPTRVGSRADHNNQPRACLSLPPSPLSPPLSAELLRDHCPKASQTSRQATDALHAVQPEGKQEGKTPIHGVCFYCLSSYPLKGCRGLRVGNSRAMTPSPTSPKKPNNRNYSCLSSFFRQKEMMQHLFYLHLLRA